MSSNSIDALVVAVAGLALFFLATAFVRYSIIIVPENIRKMKGIIQTLCVFSSLLRGAAGMFNLTLH